MEPVFTMKEGGFGVGDYIVFGVLCGLSCVGGLWYSAVGSKAEKVADVKDYLLGGRTLATFPVAMSLIASYVSGVTILGTPAEIYNYGTQYWLIVVGVTLSCLIVATIYLPVFWTLRLSSSYEYLELRFNKHVRACASFMFLLDEVLFLPLVIYVPALAFNQLTEFSVIAVAGVMVAICGLYTALGGLKAVVWTDTAQTGIMFIGLLLVAIGGTIAVGGPRMVINIADQSGRLQLDNWSFSPYERQTGWGAVVGGFLYWTCFNSVNQTMVQRYIALPSQRKAKFALFIFCLGAILAISLCVWCGLAAWASWVLGGCDPGGKPLVDDRLLPAFVTYVSKVKNLPGLPGVFLAGVFGAGLSSLSSVLNACALVVIEDIMHGWLRLKLKPLTEGILARAVTALLALISVAMVLVVEKLGGVLGVATALSAIAASATCGVFTLGMVCWWVGPRGALAGAVAGGLMAGTVSLGSQAAAAHGLKAPPLNMTMECVRNASYTNLMDPSDFLVSFGVGDREPEDVALADLPLRGTDDLVKFAGIRWMRFARDRSMWRHLRKAYVQQWTTHLIRLIWYQKYPETVFPLFRLSYHWIAPLGLITTLTVGMIVGWLFDAKETLMLDAELFTPRIWRFLPQEAMDRKGSTRRAHTERLARAHSAPLILASLDKTETNGEPSR